MWSHEKMSYELLDECNYANAWPCSNRTILDIGSIRITWLYSDIKKLMIELYKYDKSPCLVFNHDIV